MAWNIHVSCNSSCATCGIVTRGIITLAIVTGGISTESRVELAMHATPLNGTRVGTKVQLTFVIHQQLT